MQHGTLILPRTADALYEQAKRYLSRDPAESKLFKSLEHSRDGRHYHLTINHRNDDHFDPNSNDIAWDPYSALRTSSGNRLRSVSGTKSITRWKIRESPIACATRLMRATTTPKSAASSPAANATPRRRWVNRFATITAVLPTA
jgi:hypothetical protein